MAPWMSPRHPCRASEPGNSTVAPRLAGLDLLRAWAITWVMLFHASLFGLASREHWIVRFGWMGVDLFFGLSGFLIAGQLLRPIAAGFRPDYQKFFYRRVLRTFPAYLTVVVIYFTFPAFRERPDIQPLWQFLTFTQNLLIAPPLPKAFSQAWSLCVEEQFYLVLPLVLLLLSSRATTKVIIAIIASITIFGMLLRGYIWIDHVFADGHVNAGRYMRLIYWPTWARLDDLMAGVAAAALKIFRPRIWARVLAWPDVTLLVGAFGVVLSAIFFGDHIAGLWPTVFGFPLLSLSIGLIIMAGSDGRSLIGRFPVPGAGALACMAYSLYLTHKAVFRGVEQAWASTPPRLADLAGMAALLSALAVGSALYLLVERPCLRLRDRLEGPSRSSLRTARVLEQSTRRGDNPASP